MLVQIYETSSPEEAKALAELGVDHIGVLVGDGSFPRERSIENARLIFSAIPTKCKGSALLLSSDVRFIERAISELKTEILHLGASTDLLTASTVQSLKRRFGPSLLCEVFRWLAGKVSLSREATTILPTCCF